MNIPVPNYDSKTCGKFEWSSDRAGPGLNDCPACNAQMQCISTRVAE